MSNPAAPFAVNHWGSHPDAGNDDLYTGEDHWDLFLALAAYFTDPSDCSVEYIEIDGLDELDLSRLGITRERRNPNFRPSRYSDDEGRSEFAMQQGMAFGCEGYNEAMGYY